MLHVSLIKQEAQLSRS